MRNFVFIVILSLLLFSCKKNEDSDWVYCDECKREAWIGIYSGDGSFYAGYNPDETKDIAVDFSVSDLDDQRWKIKLSSEDFFVMTFIGNAVDSGCFFDQVGSTKSIHLTLYKKGNEYKISGNAKTYDVSGDSVILTKSVSFDVLKNE